MAKDVKKAQDKNINKNETKKQQKNVVTKEKKEVVAEKVETKIQPKKEFSKSKKVIEQEVIENKKEDNKITKKEKKEKNKKKLVSAVKVLDDNRKAILCCIIGFLVATLLFRCVLWPDRIATLSDGTQPVANINGEPYTADKLYEEMKKYYSVNIMLNDIDSMLLTEKYPETEEMNTSVSGTADYYYSYYETYSGYTKEEFLSNYGFENEEAFLDNLKLDYRRNKYYDDYAKSLVTDKEVDKYYEEDVFGDVDSKHILVKIDKNSEDGLSDEEAKKLAKEIITKLNDGKSWDEVIEEYKDKIVNEELGYQAFNASLESSYLEECKKLEVGKYSKTPVLTSYGYHIVFKIAQKEKPALKEVKDDVIDVLAEEKKTADKNLYNKSLIAMREEANLEFIDTKLSDEYKKYLNSNK